MKKQCWFCKNTEDFFLQQKEDLLKSIDKKLLDCEDFEKSIIDITKEKLGFTDELKEKAKSIKNEYSSMTLNAVLENKDSFLKLEPNLEIILNYCSKYGKRNFRTVNDVIQEFILEPVESRYTNELRLNETKRKSLLEKKEKLEQIKTFFIEKEITPHSLDTEIEKLKRTPEDNNFYYTFSQRRNETKEKDFSYSYQQLGFNFSRKILICPVCLSMFAESANASFDIIEAQRRAQNSWDDIDDDDEKTSVTKRKHIPQENDILEGTLKKNPKGRYTVLTDDGFAYECECIPKGISLNTRVRFTYIKRNKIGGSDLRMSTNIEAVE